MVWRHFADSDLDYAHEIGADYDDRIDAAKSEDERIAFQRDRAAVFHLLTQEVRKDAARGVSPGRMLAYYASLIEGEPFTAVEQVLRGFIDQWSAGAFIEALGAALQVEDARDVCNEVRR